MGAPKINVIHIDTDHLLIFYSEALKLTLHCDNVQNKLHFLLNILCKNSDDADNTCVKN